MIFFFSCTATIRSKFLLDQHIDPQQGIPKRNGHILFIAVNIHYPQGMSGKKWIPDLHCSAKIRPK